MPAANKPDSEELDIILQQHAVRRESVDHGRFVAKIALKIARELNKKDADLDEKLIEASALLHDVLKGKADHAVQGGRLLSELGYPEIGKIIANHMDGKMKISPNSFSELEVVFLADKLAHIDRFIAPQDRRRVVEEKFINEPILLAQAIERLQVTELLVEKLERITGMSLEKLAKDDLI